MDRTTDHAAHNAALRNREMHLKSLFVAGQDGDGRAYRTFLSELSTHLRGYLRGRLQRQPGEIEDLLQEVLLAIHNGRHTYRSDQPLTAWVFAIARYKLTDFFAPDHGAMCSTTRWMTRPNCSPNPSLSRLRPVAI